MEFLDHLEGEIIFQMSTLAQMFAQALLEEDDAPEDWRARYLAVSAQAALVPLLQSVRQVKKSQAKLRAEIEAMDIFQPDDLDDFEDDDIGDEGSEGSGNENDAAQ